MILEVITLEESGRLVQLEAVIHQGKAAFVQVGEAIAEIRDRRLYRSSHDTFEAYCQETWGWTRRNANYLITSSEVVTALPKDLGTMVPNHRVAREVAKIPAEKRAVLEYKGWNVVIGEAMQGVKRGEDGATEEQPVRQSVFSFFPEKVPLDLAGEEVRNTLELNREQFIRHLNIVERKADEAQEKLKKKRTLFAQLDVIWEANPDFQFQQVIALHELSLMAAASVARRAR
jgi:hypothetical protein